jgi:hypothetical protein
VVVKTTDESFLSQADLGGLRLTEKLAGDVPQSSAVCGGRLLPEAAAVFMERHIERPG